MAGTFSDRVKWSGEEDGESVSVQYGMVHFQT